MSLRRYMGMHGQPMPIMRQQQQGPRPMPGTIPIGGGMSGNEMADMPMGVSMGGMPPPRPPQPQQPPGPPQPSQAPGPMSGNEMADYPSPNKPTPNLNKFRQMRGWRP